LHFETDGAASSSDPQFASPRIGILSLAGFGGLW
jgi:hypothetical protein